MKETALNDHTVLFIFDFASNVIFICYAYIHLLIIMLCGVYNAGDNMKITQKDVFVIGILLLYTMGIVWSW